MDRRCTWSCWAEPSPRLLICLRLVCSSSLSKGFTTQFVGLNSLLTSKYWLARAEAVHGSTKAVDEETRWRLQKDWQSLCALQARQGTGGDY